jgi:hypothetical protein
MYDAKCHCENTNQRRRIVYSWARVATKAKNYLQNWMDIYVPMKGMMPNKDHTV